MNKKLLSLCVALSSAVIANGVEFSGFNIFGAGYSNMDLRFSSYQAPFPIIFHYLQGGTSSIAPDYRILRNDNPNNVPNGLPAGITIELQTRGIQNVQYFEAYCKAENRACNYFTHLWSMDKMVENRIANISSGIYAPNNLTAFQGQIGVNNLVQQSMSFHDKIYLSGNVARFTITNMNQVADAWFLSVYAPKVNQGVNAQVNQTSKAIVIHWYIFPPNFDNNQTNNQHLREVLTNWDTGNTFESLTPQFIPQQ